MVPKHNDDPYSDDEEEQQTEVCTPQAPTAAAAAAYRFPLKLTSSLTGEFIVHLLYRHAATLHH